MRTIWNFYSAGRLVFGAWAAQRVGGYVSERGWRRVFLVTDKRLAAARVTALVWRALADAGVLVELFDEGQAEPAVGVAVAAAAAARQFQPDAVLGLGGGSNMDLAKIVAVLLTHGGEPARYFGYGNVPGPVLPLVCLPTTAGTGSEVSHAAVLTDEANHIKVSTLSQFLRPALAVVDPLLTVSCPPKVTADSGIDALTHAVEALTAVDYSQLPLPPDEPAAYEGANPLGGCLAEKAIALVGQHLAAAVADGQNLAAREGMALASTLAGLAFSNCAVALVHALEYPIGAVLHCSHGAGNGLLLPYVMRFNLPACPEKFARIAACLGVNTAGLSATAAGEAGIAKIEELRAQIGIPQRIRELGGSADQLPLFAEKAFAIKRLRDVNPRPATQQDLLGILQAAW